MAQKLIEVHDLKKYYNGGDVKALDGVTADVYKGDVIAVIGPSGGGKSTFLRSLNLLETPTSGSILFNGVDITGKKVDLPLHRQKMGMVFQHFNLFPNRSVLENLTMAPIKIKKSPKAEAEAKAMALLQRVGLADRANDYPAQLSGGQKQRPEAGHGVSGKGGHGALHPSQAPADLRRPEAAGGHRPGPGHGAGGHAV